MKKYIFHDCLLQIPTNQTDFFKRDAKIAVVKIFMGKCKANARDY